MALMETEDVTKSFPTKLNVVGRPTEHVHALRGVSISLAEGETLAVVGESGSGKSTLARVALRLIEPDSGAVRFEGTDVSTFKRSEMRSLRRHMQMIFQDPYTSLDPRMVVADQVAEPLKVHKLGAGGEERRARVVELMRTVGLGADQLDRFPYEFSGGQLQRVAIARAMATEPKVLVCDEPVAALDMSIRAQVVNLLRDLQDERGIALLFISHDLSLVRMIAHRVAVMREGEIVETGPTAELFADPQHEYTRELLSAVPVPDPRRRTPPRMTAERRLPAFGHRRLFAAAAGSARIKDAHLEVRTERRDVGLRGSSALLTASGVWVFYASPGARNWTQASPAARLLAVWLRGVSELRLDDGTRSRFVAGDVLLVDDVGSWPAIDHTPDVVLLQVGLEGPVPDEPPAPLVGSLHTAEAPTRLVVHRFHPQIDGASTVEDLTPTASSIRSDAVALLAPVSNAEVIIIPDGESDSGWHCAPRRQLVVWLSGTSEIESSDGQRRSLGPGSVLLVEDTTGTGHRISHAGETQVLFLHLDAAEVR